MVQNVLPHNTHFPDTYCEAHHILLPEDLPHPSDIVPEGRISSDTR